MIVYLLTEEQKNSLIGKRYFSNSYFNPIQDINDNWIISEEEVLTADNEDILWVKDLEQIEYEPKPIERPF
jgi:hypothetical protein